MEWILEPWPYIMRSTIFLIIEILFGLGWAMAGACPRSMFVMTDAGYFPILVVIAGAMLGI